MTGKGAKKAPKKKANGYKLPEPIPNGEILTDLAKKQWIIGPSIGVGGFGEIYSAAVYTGGKIAKYPYVIKIEPHENGPLFVEMHFYVRNAKPDDIKNWKQERHLSFLGMPSYIGSGSHECNNQKYRFVVMERYGQDLWKLFLENGRRFPEHTVYKVALQIVDVFEYMHNRQYIHADIKGANLLLGLKSPDHVYVVDFGLASRHTSMTVLKEDPKKAHNGTIEYTSRDAHIGVPTMRGDFEILGYNMIHWLCGSLPWEKLTDPVAVMRQKQEAMNNIDKFLSKSFSGVVPEPVKEYMTLLHGLDFNETPNHAAFREILIKGLKALGHNPNGQLEFKAGDKTQKRTPVKAKKSKLEAARKSPRAQQVKSPSSAASPLNDSDLGSVMISQKGKGTSDKRRILKNIELTDDSDMEIEIKITKKKKQKKDANAKEASENNKTPVRRSPRKLAEQRDHNQTGSDFETEVLSRGTKSRPRVILKTESKEQAQQQENSEEDMFGDDDDAGPTPPKKVMKSWKDLPTIKAGKSVKSAVHRGNAADENSTKKRRR